MKVYSYSFFAFVCSSFVWSAKKVLSHIHVTLAKQIRLHSFEGWTWEQLVVARHCYMMMDWCVCVPTLNFYEILVLTQCYILQMLITRVKLVFFLFTTEVFLVWWIWKLIQLRECWKQWKTVNFFNMFRTLSLFNV